MPLKNLPDWIKSTKIPVYPCQGNTPLYKPGIPTKELIGYSITLSASELAEKLQTLYRDEPAFAQQVSKHGGSWAGLINETAADIIKNTISTTAQADFRKAMGKLQTPLIGGSIVLKNRGPSFSMGRVLQGHPIACLRREKTKLPPINLNLGLFVSASVKPEAVSISLAKIVRAAWEYKLAGGAVKIKLHTFTDFSTPNSVHTGVILHLDLPLMNSATLATYAGIQGYRVLFLSLATSLSGSSSDLLPNINYPAIPGCMTLTGNPENDTAIVAALKIK